MKFSLSIFLIILIYGCGSTHNIQLTPNLKLISQSVHIDAPPSSYGVAWEAWYLTSTKNNIQLFRHLPNMMSEDVSIEASDLPKEGLSRYLMLNREKNTDLEQIVKNTPLSDWETKNNAERGVKYRKKYVDFIGGLKCITRVESGNIALGIGRKSYQTNCNYFDTNGNPKLIHFDYHYVYTHSGTKYDSDTKSSSVTPEAMQNQFKQDMKAIFDSLVIHDMDRERMAKEGLLHDQKYEIQEW